MKMKHMKNRLSLILCIMLIVAMALFTTACNDNTTQESSTTTGEAKAAAQESFATTSEAETAAQESFATTSEAEAAAEETETTTQESSRMSEAESTVQTEVTVLGEGNTKFLFTVVDKDGNETQFEIHTDKATVGEALLELELIAGDESEFGLYVKTVNGITADYEKDGVYWAFFINDEYASTGVDTTDIVEGDSYAFKAVEA